jgi:hypothetical protein
VKYPTTLSADSDVPFDEKVFYVPYHDALVYHVAGKLLLAEGRAPEAQVYLHAFSDAMKAMKDRIGQPAEL